MASLEKVATGVSEHSKKEVLREFREFNKFMNVNPSSTILDAFRKPKHKSVCLFKRIRRTPYQHFY